MKKAILFVLIVLLLLSTAACSRSVMTDEEILEAAQQILEERGESLEDLYDAEPADSTNVEFEPTP